MKISILVVIVASILSLSLPAAAGGGSAGGATEFTQLVNMAELIKQYEEQVQQTQAQLLNLAKMGDSVANDPNGYLNKLSAAVEQADALGFASARSTGRLEKYYGSNFTQGAPYTGANYADWMKTTKDTIRAAVRSVGVQQDQFDTEAQAILKLKSMSGSSQGNLQVAQTGNQIALQMVEQLQKLRAMNMAQAQAVNARMLALQNKEENNNEVGRRFFGGADVNLDAKSINKIKGL